MQVCSTQTSTRTSAHNHANNHANNPTNMHTHAQEPCFTPRLIALHHPVTIKGQHADRTNHVDNASLTCRTERLAPTLQGSHLTRVAPHDTFPSHCKRATFTHTPHMQMLPALPNTLKCRPFKSALQAQRALIESSLTLAFSAACVLLLPRQLWGWYCCF
jgi:hypothetical protein